MSKLSTILASGLLAVSLAGCMSSAPKLTGTNGNDLVKFEAPKTASLSKQTIEATFNANGYKVEAISNLEKPFAKKFNDTRFDVFKVFAMYNNELSEKLIAKYPDMGAFTPFSITVQSAKGSDKVSATFLDADTIKKVLGITECKLLDKLEAQNIATLKKLGFAVDMPVKFDYKPVAPKGDLLYKHTLTGDAEELADKMDETLASHGFKVVNYLDLKTAYNSVDEKYEFYTVLSVCKKKVLNLASKTRPEAAAFAPCSLAIYKEKGSDKVVFAFPSTWNWLSSLNITDPAAVKILKDEQVEIQHFIEGLAH
jgi:uncharacterized protein (DUF302 family)